MSCPRGVPRSEMAANSFPLESRRLIDHRQVVEGIAFRYRTGVQWRDLPERFGPWQTVWKRHHRFATDGTWDRVLAAAQADAQAAGGIDWNVSVDSTIARAHQHSATAKREDRARLGEHTADGIE